MAQGHADPDRSAGRRGVERAEPVPGLPPDGHLHSRVGFADLQPSRAISPPTETLQIRRRRLGTSGACTWRRTRPDDGTIGFRSFPAKAWRWPAARRARRSRRWTDERARFKSPRPISERRIFERAAGCSMRANTICSLPGAVSISSNSEPTRPKRCSRTRISTALSRANRRCRSTPSRRTFRIGSQAIRPGRTAKAEDSSGRSTIWLPKA